MRPRDPTRQDTILIARERLERTKAWMLMAGCGGVVGGVLVAAVPMTGAMILGIVSGIVLCGAGLVQMLRGMLFHRWRPRVIAARLTSGVTAGVIGCALLWEPHPAIAALGLALAVLAIAHGAARGVAMIREGDSRWWLWAALAGAMTVLLAGVLAAGWPGTAVWAFGMVGGLVLFCVGLWLILLATAADSRTEHDLAGKWRG